MKTKVMHFRSIWNKKAIVGVVLLNGHVVEVCLDLQVFGSFD